jgi:hypothetical protein
MARAGVLAKRRGKQHRSKSGGGRTKSEAADTEYKKWETAYPEPNVETPAEFALHERESKAAMREWGAAAKPYSLFTPKDDAHLTRIVCGLMHIVSKHASVYDSVILGWNNVPKELADILGYWIIEQSDNRTFIVENFKIVSPTVMQPTSALEAIHRNLTYEYGTTVQITKVVLKERWMAILRVHESPDLPDEEVMEYMEFTDWSSLVDHVELEYGAYLRSDYKLRPGRHYARMVSRSMTLTEYVVLVGLEDAQTVQFVKLPIMVGGREDHTPPHALGAQVAKAYFVVHGPKNAAIRAIPTKLMRAQHTIRAFVDTSTNLPVARIVFVGGAFGHTATTVTHVKMPGPAAIARGKTLEKYIPSIANQPKDGEVNGCVVAQLQSYRIDNGKNEDDLPLPLRYPLFIVLATMHEFWTMSIRLDNQSKRTGVKAEFDHTDYDWTITPQKIERAYDKLMAYLVETESESYAQACQPVLQITKDASLKALAPEKYYGYPIIGYRHGTKEQKNLYLNLAVRMSVLTGYSQLIYYKSRAAWDERHPNEQPPPEAIDAWRNGDDHSRDFVIGMDHPEYDQYVAAYVLGRATSIVFGGPLDHQPLTDFYEGAIHTMRRITNAYLRVAVAGYTYENPEHWARRTCVTVSKLVTDTTKVKYMMWLRRLRNAWDDKGDAVSVIDAFARFGATMKELIDGGSAESWGKIEDRSENKAEKATASALGTAVSTPAIMHYIGAVYGVINSASPDITSRLDDPSQVPFVDPFGTPGDTAHGGHIRLLSQLTHFTQFHDPSMIRNIVYELLEDYEMPVELYDSDFDILVDKAPPESQKAAEQERKKEDDQERQKRRNRRRRAKREAPGRGDKRAQPNNVDDPHAATAKTKRPPILRITINQQTVWTRKFDKAIAREIEQVLWTSKGLYYDPADPKPEARLPFDVAIERTPYTINIQCTQGRVATPCLRTKQYKVIDRIDPVITAGRSVLSSLSSEYSQGEARAQSPPGDPRAYGGTRAKPAHVDEEDQPDYEYVITTTPPGDTVYRDTLPPSLQDQVNEDGYIGSTLPMAYDYIMDNLRKPMDDPNEARSHLEIMAAFDYKYLLERGWLVWCCAEDMQDVKNKPADDWGDKLSPHKFVLVSPTQAFSPQSNMTIGYNNIQGTRAEYAATTRKSTLGAPNLLTKTNYQKKAMALCNSFSEIIQCPGHFALGTNMSPNTHYARTVLGSWKGAQIEDCTTISERMVASGICSTMLTTTVRSALDSMQENYRLGYFHDKSRDDVYASYMANNPHLVKYSNGVTAVKVGTPTKTDMPLVLKYSTGSTTLMGASKKTPHYTSGVVSEIVMRAGPAPEKSGITLAYSFVHAVDVIITTLRDGFEGVKPTTPAAQKAVIGVVAPDVLFPHVDGHPLHMIAGATGEPSRNTPSRMLRWVMLAVAAACGELLYIDGFCALRMPNDPVLAEFLEERGVYLKRTIKDSNGVVMGIAGVGFQQLNVTSHHAESKFQVTAADEVPLDGIDPGSRNNRKGRGAGHGRVSYAGQEAAMFPTDPETLRAFLGALITPDITNLQEYPVCVPCQSLGYIKVIYDKNTSSTTYKVMCSKCSSWSKYSSNFRYIGSTDGAKFGKISLRHTLIQMSRYARGANIEYKYEMSPYTNPDALKYENLPETL